MPLEYELSKFAFYPEGEDLTEQEHKDSCDINLMIRSLSRGIEVRGRDGVQYGYDDTTMSGIEFRIQKQNLERDLAETARTHEFSEEEFEQIPPDLQKKFGFKKASKKDDIKRDEPNDAKKVVPKDAEKPENQNSTTEQ